MDFTSAFQGLAHGKALTPNEILRALRLDIAAELDAVNLYQSHVEAIRDPHIQAVFARIRDDEKEHVAQFVTLLSELDPDQSENLDKARIDLETTGSPLLRYPNIAERVEDIDRRVAAFDKTMR